MAKVKKQVDPVPWRDRIQNTMSAIAFAEENAPEMAKEFLHGGERGEYVLVVVRDERFESRAMNYAVDLCERMQCGLAILHVASNRWLDAQSLLKGIRVLQQKLLKNVPIQMYSVRGAAPEAVRDFVKKNRRVVSVVLPAREDQGDELAAKTSAKPWWQDLRCPVVLIPATDRQL